MKKLLLLILFAFNLNAVEYVFQGTKLLSYNNGYCYEYSGPTDSFGGKYDSYQLNELRWSNGISQAKIWTGRTYWSTSYARTLQVYDFYQGASPYGERYSCWCDWETQDYDSSTRTCVNKAPSYDPCTDPNITELISLFTGDCSALNGLYGDDLLNAMGLPLTGPSLFFDERCYENTGACYAYTTTDSGQALLVPTELYVDEATNGTDLSTAPTPEQNTPPTVEKSTDATKENCTHFEYCNGYDFHNSYTNITQCQSQINRYGGGNGAMNMLDDTCDTVFKVGCYYNSVRDIAELKEAEETQATGTITDANGSTSSIDLDLSATNDLLNTLVTDFQNYKTNAPTKQSDAENTQKLLNSLDDVEKAILGNRVDLDTIERHLNTIANKDTNVTVNVPESNITISDTNLSKVEGLLTDIKGLLENNATSDSNSTDGDCGWLSPVIPDDFESIVCGDYNWENVFSDNMPSDAWFSENSVNYVFSPPSTACSIENVVLDFGVTQEELFNSDTLSIIDSFLDILGKVLITSIVLIGVRDFLRT